VTQAETDAGERPGLTSDEGAELARLRRENRSLREDVEVLCGILFVLYTGIRGSSCRRSWASVRA
jgi:hypothetical protein